MYADGKPVRAILAETEFSLDQLFRALDGLPPSRSLDRLDVLVWAVTALSFAARQGPRVMAL